MKRTRYYALQIRPDSLWWIKEFFSGLGLETSTINMLNLTFFHVAGAPTIVHTKEKVTPEKDKYLKTAMSGAAGIQSVEDITERAARQYIEKRNRLIQREDTEFRYQFTKEAAEALKIRDALEPGMRLHELSGGAVQISFPKENLLVHLEPLKQRLGSSATVKKGKVEYEDKVDIVPATELLKKYNTEELAGELHKLEQVFERGLVASKNRIKKRLETLPEFFFAARLKRKYTKGPKKGREEERLIGSAYGIRSDITDTVISKVMEKTVARINGKHSIYNPLGGDVFLDSIIVDPEFRDHTFEELKKTGKAKGNMTVAADLLDRLYSAMEDQGLRRVAGIAVSQEGISIAEKGDFRSHVTAEEKMITHVIETLKAPPHTRTESKGAFTAIINTEKKIPLLRDLAETSLDPFKRELEPSEHRSAGTVVASYIKRQKRLMKETATDKEAAQAIVENMLVTHSPDELSDKLECGLAIKFAEHEPEIVEEIRRFDTLASGKYKVDSSKLRGRGTFVRKSMETEFKRDLAEHQLRLAVLYKKSPIRKKYFGPNLTASNAEGVLARRFLAFYRGHKARKTRGARPL